MTYFEDLTDYTYRGTQAGFENAQNIGWLDKAQPFVEGKTSKLFARRLLRFCEIYVHAMRGLHGCAFCKRAARVLVEYQGKTLKLGFAEIRVFHLGKVYAAPNLIYHYVTEHRYQPPQEFIDGVIQGPQPSGKEYSQLLEGTGLSFFPANGPEHKRLADEYRRTTMAEVIAMEKQPAKKKRAVEKQPLV